MIPIYTTGDGYKMLFPGGMRSLATTLLVCSIPGTVTYVRQGVFLPPQGVDDILRMINIQLNKVTELQIPYCPPLYGFWQHPVRDEFWDQNGVAALQNVDIPTWIWGSWDDLFVNGSVDDYLTLSSPNKMIAMGYTSHASIGVEGLVSGVQGELRGLVTGFDHTREALRWFDRWLKGIDNGIDEDLRTRRFRYLRYQDWQSRQAKNYPIPGTVYTRYYLNSTSSLLSNLLSGVDGTLSTAVPVRSGSSSYAYIPATNGLAAGAFSGFLRLHNQTDPKNGDILAYNEPLGRLDQRLDPLGRVVYLSEPLENDLEITGPITMRLYAETTASDTDWVAKLIDVVPNSLASFSVAEPQPGYWHLVQPGHLKGGFRSYQGDYRRSTPIPTGQVVAYDVQIWPTSWLFKKGHRIGVTIASSDFPYVFPNLNPAVIKVHHSAQYPSHIVLPVIPKSQPDSTATAH
jgi:putative CocE/NonD family hydrolase